MSFPSASDQEVESVDSRAKTEEVEVAVEVVAVLVAIELVVLSVASKYPPEHSNRHLMSIYSDLKANLY
jgi:hypothetical protein